MPLVYMTQTISTIVDSDIQSLFVPSLYDPNNFYYCRSLRIRQKAFHVYMTQTISTIVDSRWHANCGFRVYMTQTISTIVD